MESNSNGRFKVECPICLQEYVNPVQLPCNHIFCYLCVKGAANTNNRCALCRQEISDEFFEKPFLLEKEDEIEIALYDNAYHWFYEGRNGWWLYDQRTSEDIEIAYKNGQKQLELLIAGHLYMIDFDSMVQFRRNDIYKRRRIKRDTKDNNFIKGVSGIQITNHEQTENVPEDNSPTETVKPVTPTAPEEILVNNSNQLSLRIINSASTSSDRPSNERTQSHKLNPSFHQQASSQPQPFCGYGNNPGNDNHLGRNLPYARCGNKEKGQQQQQQSNVTTNPYQTYNSQIFASVRNSQSNGRGPSANEVDQIQNDVANLTLNSYRETLL